MSRRAVLLILVMLSVIVSAGWAQEAADAPVGIDDICGESALAITALDDLPEDDTTKALDDLLRAFVTRPEDGAPPLTIYGAKPPAPGAVIFVDSPQGQYYRAIGASDIDSCTPIDPSMPFAIGSNTKMMTAAVIYQLQEEGLLSTSDLVSQYLPDEISLFAGGETITIDMLLGHTSGLPDYLNSTNPGTVGGRYSTGDWSALPEARTPEALVAEAANDPLLFEPGAEAQWSYSNTGYIMLGLIIEKATGMSYIDAVTERVIERLGLEDTVLVAGVAPVELGLSGQYLSSPFTRETSGWNFSQAWSAGNGVSTPQDMATFLRAFYSGALYQNPATLDAMMTRAAPGYAQGSDNVLYYMHGGYYKSGFLGHGGQTLGTESDLGYNPDQDVVIVTWANSSESLTGRGIYHIGHALGLTPSWDDAYAEISGIGQSQQSSQDVIGITFNAVGVYLAATQEFKAPDDGTTYSITLGEGGQLSIVADCNTLTATFTEGEAGAFSIDLGASTLVACPEGSIADDFLGVLADASSLTIADIGGILSINITTPDESYAGFTGTR